MPLLLMHRLQLSADVYSNDCYVRNTYQMVPSVTSPTPFIPSQCTPRPLVFPPTLIHLPLPPPQLPIITFIQILFLRRLRRAPYPRLPHRLPAPIKLRSLLPLNLFTDSDRLVPSESLAHVHHAAFAFAVAFFELLAAGGEGVDERGA